MTAFLADGDPPSDRTTMVFTPHTEGHTSGRFADPPRAAKTLVPIATLHGTQPAVGVYVAADFSAPHHRSNIHQHHEHQPTRTPSVILPFAIDNEFINDFNAFYDAFIQSPTYARARSDDNRASIVDDDDDDNDDDDVVTSLDPDATMTSAHRLRLALQDWKKVNRHIVKTWENLPPTPDNDTPSATTVQPSPMLVDSTQQPTLCPEPPTLCPEPPRDDAPQYVPLRAPPPVPDPAIIPLQQPEPSLLPADDGPQQPEPCQEPQRDCPPQHVTLRAPPPAPDPAIIPLQQPAPQIACISCIVPGELPRATIPDPTRNPCRIARHPQSTKPTIPNWARPAVPPIATPMEDVVYAGNHWPPPRPPMKPVPFRKKPQNKHALGTRRQEKDSLRPP